MEHATPAWLVGLLIVFAVALAAVFGLFLYRHAELAALEEQRATMETILPGLRERAAQLEARIQPLDDRILARRTKLRQLVEDETITKTDLDRLNAENEVRRSTNQEAQNKEVKTYEELMKEAPERRKELAQEEEKLYAQERDNDERRRGLRDKIEIMSQQIEKLKKEALGDQVVDQRRIDELEDRVRQLTQQIDLNNRALKSDGQIIANQSMDGFVVIDRGNRHNLKRGTRFTIYNLRGGRNVVKGAVEVIAVDERIATARVLDERDGNDPLIVGDHLHNPIYDPDKQRGFAIAGDFTRFSRAELRHLVEEYGGRVDAAMTTQTDYLVAGGNAEAATNQATKLGVSILSEDQLLEFVRLRPTFATQRGWDYVAEQAKAGKTFVLAGRFTRVDSGIISSYLGQAGGRTSGILAADSAALIVGEGAEADMARARELGVPVIDQSQFSHLKHR